MEPVYELFAVRYARRPNERDDGPTARGSIDMDYFTWLVRTEDDAVVVDAGFTEQTAHRKGRVFLRSPIATLSALGVTANDVRTVVLSHLHYDHTGYVSSFPSARYVLQEKEMAFWTGRYASRSRYRNLVNVDDLAYLVRANVAGRIQWVDGDAEVLPGISVHWVGGHTAGQQVVRVNTKQGHAVLASDAVHFYREIDDDEPYHVVHYMPDMYSSFEKIKSLTDDRRLVVAGHDPLVRTRYSTDQAQSEFVTKIA